MVRVIVGAFNTDQDTQTIPALQCYMQAPDNLLNQQPFYVNCPWDFTQTQIVAAIKDGAVALAASAYNQTITAADVIVFAGPQ